MISRFEPHPKNLGWDFFNNYLKIRNQSQVLLIFYRQILIFALYN